MIPDQHELTLPFLRLARDSEIHLQTAVRRLGFEFSLSNEELKIRYPNGNLKFENSVSFAKTYLKQAGLIYYPRRGYSLATDLGKEILSSQPKRIDRQFLEQFEGWRYFRERKGTRVRKNKRRVPSPFELAAPVNSPEAKDVTAVAQLDELKSILESKFSELVDGKIMLGSMNLSGVVPSHPIYRLAVVSNELMRVAYVSARNDDKQVVPVMRHHCAEILELIGTLDVDADLYSQKLQKFENDVKPRVARVPSHRDRHEMGSAESSALENILSAAYNAINDSFTEELIKRVRQLDELEFATIISNLIKAMGYNEPERQFLEQEQRGASSLQIGFRIRQDAIGVVEIYVQAIQAAPSYRCGIQDIRDFERTMRSLKATSGILISTTGFEDDAVDESTELSAKLELISGVDLAKLMIEYEIGCTEREVYRLMQFKGPLSRFG